MIEVKGIRAAKAKPDDADRYEVKGLAAASRVPAVFAAMAGGLALYLRSFLPVWADEAKHVAPNRGPQPADDMAVSPDDAPALAVVPTKWEDYSPRKRPMPDDLPDDLPSRSTMPKVTGLWDDMLISSRGNSSFAAPVLASNMNVPPPMPGGSGNPILRDQGPNLQFPGIDAFGEETELQLLPDWIRLPLARSAQSEDDDDTAARNRAPASRGPVYLADVATSAVVLIGLNDLLRHASDPDGDRLYVTQITASSGTIVRMADGFRYTPSPDHIGPVTLTMTVSDGQASVRQVAYLNVIENPVHGTDGDDLLVGSVAADAVDGRDGDDNIASREGDDLIDGGSGHDNIVAGAGNDSVWGGLGDDLIFGGLGDDLMSGGQGADRLHGDAGDDMLFGDEGDDELFGGAGQDLLSGGTGDDHLDGGDGDDQLSGGLGADELAGGDGIDKLIGEQGDDTLVGGAAADYLSGGEGDDSLSGGIGDDVIDAGTGHDILDGNEGADWLAGFSGNDRLIGGTGQDTVLGGSGNDSLFGGEGSDHLDAGSGDDVIEDGAGTDAVFAGIGDDIVIAHVDLSDDSYAGGEGFDELDYSGAAEDLLIDMVASIVTGLDIGSDSISGFESITGGDGSDRFVAATTPVSFAGGEGGDIFDFTQGLTASTAFELAYQILDFGVGDRVRVSRYDFFEDLVDDISDELENFYEDRSGSEARADGRIRYRHDQTDDFEQTLIDFDLDLDNNYEMTVALHGHHLLLLVEQG